MYEAILSPVSKTLSARNKGIYLQFTTLLGNTVNF